MNESSGEKDVGYIRTHSVRNRDCPESIFDWSLRQPDMHSPIICNYLQIVQNFMHMATELTVSIDCTSFFSLLRSVKIRAEVANKGF